MEKHFIIIGTVKSGSSSIYKYLNDHPEIHLSPVKEYNFFMNIGYDWKKKNKIKIVKKRIGFALSKYSKTFKEKIRQRYFNSCYKEKGKYSGDCSINYFYYPEVPERIKRIVPESKLILVLRNPIDRVYSNYWMNFKQNKLGENSSWPWESFDNFIEKGGHKNEINIYHESLERWLNYFTRDEILILRSEVFFKDPVSILREIEDFLGISSFDYPYEHWVTPFSGRASDYPAMSETTMTELKEYFTPQVLELEKLTGKRFNWF